MCVNLPTISQVYIHTVLHGLRTKKGNPACHMWVTHLVTCVRNCFASQTQAKWFCLNAGSLCVIAPSENHQSSRAAVFHSDLREGQLEGFSRGDTHTEDRGTATPREALTVHRNTMFCTSTHAIVLSLEASP